MLLQKVEIEILLHLFCNHALYVSEAFVNLVHVAVEAPKGYAPFARFLF